jgi:hypothetical protein
MRQMEVASIPENHKITETTTRARHGRRSQLLSAFAEHPRRRERWWGRVSGLDVDIQVQYVPGVLLEPATGARGSVPVPRLSLTVDQSTLLQDHRGWGGRARGGSADCGAGLRGSRFEACRQSVSEPTARARHQRTASEVDDTGRLGQLLQAQKATQASSLRRTQVQARGEESRSWEQ